jgi:flagellar motor component MotA
MSGSSGLGAFINLQGVLIVVGGTAKPIALTDPPQQLLYASQEG